ncbi:MAG: cadmium-translocating P-type ATPase, partial [Magnetococcales bacterium]|nr:cadmium-translocating P-type ATPase [Magnetococcales bacterium]
MSATDPCYHCGLPTPSGAPILLEQAGQEPLRFCCSGCKTAYQLIHEAGLESYYQQRDDAPFGPRPEEPSEALQAAFDSEIFQQQYLRALPDGHQEVHLLLEGIHCAACVWLNEKVMQRTPGVREAQVNFSTHRARLVWDPGQTRLSEIIAAIHRIGYRAEPYDPQRIEARFQRRNRALLMKLGVAGFGAGNVMLLAVALYAGFFQGMEAKYKEFFHWVSLLIATPVVFYSGGLFLQGAWRGLQFGRLNMDVPIALGMLVTYFYSLWMTVSGQGEVYFDSVTMFVFVLLTGRFLESSARRRAAGATERLLRLEPQTATRINPDGHPEEIPIRALQAGDRVLVKPGERMPADGPVLEGRTSIDASMLTGEGMPVVKGPGDSVAAGTVNLEGAITFEAQRVGENSTLARIVRLVERAQSERPPIQTLADRIAAWFVGAILILAALTFLYWVRIDPDRALIHTVSLLIITCPCALGLATPAAMIVATGRAAQEGILMAGGECVERLSRAQEVILDKTGTLTRGRPSLRHLVPSSGISEAQLLGLAAAVESRSEHPLANAIVEAALSRKVPKPGLVTEVVNQPGIGISARVDGRLTRVGRPELLSDAPSIPPFPDEDPLITWVGCLQEGRFMGWIGLTDALRRDAPEAVRRLKAAGVRTSILSGDRPASAQAVGAALAMDHTQGGLLPDEKAQRVAALQQAGRVVVMVGDGINDAPALAQADVSMAVKGASEISIAAADVTLINDRLEATARAIELSRVTMAVIRQNFTFSLLYNVAAIPLAMAGYVQPVVAAIAMPI